MTLYVLIKYLHVLGAIVILGTGTGIAFERMRSGRQCHFKDVPHTIRQQLREFAVRATKYYQTVNCVVCA